MTVFFIGAGPGDPELITVKAARLIGAAGVVAYHSARHGRSNARAIAEAYLRPGQIEERLVYPITTETTDHPGGYQGAIDDFYAQAAATLAAHLDAGRDVVVLAEGDPFFYGSYMHMHKRLAAAYETEVVPGVTVGGARGETERNTVERVPDRGKNWGRLAPIPETPLRACCGWPAARPARRARALRSTSRG